MKRFLCLLLLVFSLTLLCSCEGFGAPQSPSGENNSGTEGGSNIPTVYEYADADKYASGDTSVYILLSKINIEWQGGEVEFKERMQQNISFFEYCDGELSEDFKLHYYYDGNAMRIRPSASGVKISDIPDKKLTVYVPMNYTFQNVVVSTDTADVTMSGVNTISADFSSISGALSISDSEINDNLKLSTGSGSISVALGGYLSTLDITSVSGNAVVRCAVYDSISSLSESGDVDISSTYTPATVDMTSDGGDIMLALPADAGFVLDVAVGEGNFGCEFDGENMDGEYTVGNGAASVQLDSRSGAVKVNICK